MFYIVFDLEFNQDFLSLQNFNRQDAHYPFEIIEIGAVKLDEDLHTVGTFDAYVKPTFYAEVNPFITELTGITTDQLLSAKIFPEVYHEYMKFIGEGASVFGIWGMSDIKELFRNASYHQLDNTPIPRAFINIQPLVSTYFNLPAKKLLKLQDAVQMLHIPISHPFHHACHDAYYTSEIFRQVYHTAIKPAIYDPLYRPSRPQTPKKQIDFEGLIAQFEKMYSRTLSEEEQHMIKLAYKMGKTHQFLK